MPSRRHRSSLEPDAFYARSDSQISWYAIVPASYGVGIRMAPLRAGDAI
jgi:hypothetical protein